MTKQQDIGLDDNEILCHLTGQKKKVSGKETNLQSVIRLLNEEHAFFRDDMERDFNIKYTDPESGNDKRQKIDLVVFSKGAEHIQENIIRLCLPFSFY